jgi:hypothetical protein
MHPRLVLPLLVLVMLALVAPSISAQVIHRCRAADGITLFSDRPCHVHGATPIAAPEPLPGTEIAPGITLHSPVDTDIPDAAMGCPAVHPYQLQERIREALWRRDINALAGLYAWNGAGRQQAQQVLRGLQSLIDDPARSIELLDAGWLADASPRLPANVAIDGLTAQSRYQMVRSAGCVWLAG